MTMIRIIQELMQEMNAVLKAQSAHFTGDKSHYLRLLSSSRYCQSLSLYRIPILLTVITRIIQHGRLQPRVL